MKKNISHLMTESEHEKSGLCGAFNTTQIELDDRLVQKEKTAQLKIEAKNLRERSWRKQGKLSRI